MTEFTVGKAVATDTPSVTVDGLAAGRHEFTLVVVDDAGRRSEPASVTVTVSRPG